MNIVNMDLECLNSEPSCCSRGQEGLSWIEWEGERFEFKDAPSYSEKNWGGAFPRKWFWLQCNVFEGTSGEVTLTAAGGVRQLPGPAGSEIHENAALIGVHSDGIFYEFVPWNGVVNWEVSPWGYWHMSAENEKHLVELEARAKDLGTPILAPTVEAGLAPACIDTCSGVLKLQMWERRQDGTRGKVILKVTSDMAAVEVGGGPWFTNWKGKTSAPELLRRALRVPIDLDAVYNSVPFFKPPGL
uniref:Tocopherol cyclase n=1 Tax=Populus davidiana TaxID=266767 RepID=A0A6M2EGC4_9ROSI